MIVNLFYKHLRYFSLLSNKNYLNTLIIIGLTILTFWWTFFIFHIPFDSEVVLVVILLRILASRFIFKDYSLAWSKASSQSFLIKSSVNIVAFLATLLFFYGDVYIYFLLSELFLYLFIINFIMYMYAFLTNKKYIKKTKKLIVYGTGERALNIVDELKDSEYRVAYFIDDSKKNSNRSIDSVRIISMKKFLEIKDEDRYDLLLIALPNADKEELSLIYDSLKSSFKDIKILPSFQDILKEKPLEQQLKPISIEDLLLRKPKDLDNITIANFISAKTVLITGAGGSIGSELSRQVVAFGAKQIILLDHSEFNLYQISEELKEANIVSVMLSVKDREALDKIFMQYLPDVVIHAAAYKHVPLCEENIDSAIENNVFGTKNVIDLSVKYEVEKFVLISTDKAVRPTNVMGTTKRICELYAHAIPSNKTEIVAVRFGNVLGSSGSVIPKFQSQIEKGEDITVTHPEITRYFMMIPEACQLVLQAASIAKGGELFILDMGEPIKIVDLAKKMIELSGRDDIKIKFTGLRAGEKLYEELLIDDADLKTEYDSILVSQNPPVDYEKLLAKLEELKTRNRLEVLKEIVPEFNHKV